MITTGFWIGIGLMLAVVVLYLVIIAGYIIFAIIGGLYGAITEAAAKEWNDKRDGWF